MLYIVYKELLDGVKERLIITNDKEIADKCRSFHDGLCAENVMIEETAC